MSTIRSLVATVTSGLLGFGLMNGCGTDAVGVDDCREIEQQRCESAVSCGIVAAGDVDACKRFYRDHCLHGLATDNSPGGPGLRKCIETIRRAGECARANGAEAPVSSCMGDLTPSTSPLAVGKSLACDIVVAPESAQECSFLAGGEFVPSEAGIDTGTASDAGDAASDDAGDAASE